MPQNQPEHVNANAIQQVLLTMGQQRETAGRGTMAVYIQVNPLSHSAPRST